ncbi:hypothetical protein SPSYN_01436 [Sporotomaculum syntrophicum]|uniref:tRNA(Ile2) 2-agmatinylcytidine synthetase n=1 Tax=Sporotomaculum syntrophicum TaxID=182264 RepID=A0A9D3AWD6_9FIRM|nr:hypothetical protein [Sporotomaculum syntrophicum]KAF1085300.1 hypothetical protein SPSYN_01436 [Sporotomaculum syntrophicum]
MRVLVCIDDTDNLDSKGTGEIAEAIAKGIEKQGWGKSYGITRHQLLVHPDIPYTSHNSAMCFPVMTTELHLQDIISYAQDLLEQECAEGSDPGLCVCVPQLLSNQSLLTDFGYTAKQFVLTKDEAYDLAARLNIHLSEHGGTGQGVIGALAGAGLRLGGNDGRFKGKLKIDTPDNTIRVGDILSNYPVDLVQSLDGQVLNKSEVIRLGEKVKKVLLRDKSVVLVYRDKAENGAPCWKTCTKQQLRVY